MNKLVSYLSRRADWIAVQRAEREFIEGFDGGQSKRDEADRRRARCIGMLPWVAIAISAAGVMIQFMRR